MCIHVFQWDGTIGKWQYFQNEDTDDEYSETSDSDDDSSHKHFNCGPRRSKRLQCKEKRLQMAMNLGRHGVFN